MSVSDSPLYVSDLSMIAIKLISLVFISTAFATVVDDSYVIQIDDISEPSTPRTVDSDVDAQLPIATLEEAVMAVNAMSISGRVGRASEAAVRVLDTANRVEAEAYVTDLDPHSAVAPMIEKCDSVTITKTTIYGLILAAVTACVFAIVRYGN